jgi:FlaG/FlaF family flagellin (archaellin)
MDLVRNRRAAESVVGVVLLVGVVVIIGAVTTTLAFGFIEDAEEGQAYSATFSFEHTGGELLVTPEYRPDDITYHLQLNGNRAHTWTGDRTQRLRCLFPGDTASIVADGDGTENSYLLREYEVQSATECGLSGTAAQFAYARVGEKKLSLRKQNYEFTLYIDPDGPGSVNGSADIPLSNPWHYQQRFSKDVEYGSGKTLSGPVYLFVLADNVDNGGSYSTDPQPDHYEQQDDAYNVNAVDDETVSIEPTPGQVEPTDDVYLLFKPGCSESSFVIIEYDAGYENQILLGDDVFIDNAKSAPRNQKITTDVGVTCT